MRESEYLNGLQTNFELTARQMCPLSSRCRLIRAIVVGVTDPLDEKRLEVQYALLCRRGCGLFGATIYQEAINTAGEETIRQLGLTGEVFIEGE